MARPKGNVTGVIFAVDAALVEKRLQLLRELVPSLARIGVLLQSDYAPSTVVERALPSAAAALNLEIRTFAVTGAAGLDAAFAVAEREAVEALYVGESPLFFSQRPRLVGLAERLRRPVIYGFPEFVPDGGLIAYGVSLRRGYRQAAAYVDKILKGAKPGDLAVEQLAAHELAVNLKTAAALGLTIPTPILLRADEVIE
ncbi:MAG: ABC transporter substrate-binding protein [Proteobacteria bacterium]|nr:ABC transporter substrate-binding protein [Pseudomonadota bacterium]